jgi:serine/threonine protein kinase/tetratricopeptide (TPR) repeat protein
MSHGAPHTTVTQPRGGAALEAEPASNSRLVQALDDYLERVRDGHAPDKAEFLAEYPEVANELDPCLGGLEMVVGALRPGRPAVCRDEDMLRCSTVLGDFRIVRVLGRGGMGVVYEAEQVSLGRRVALKVLPFASSLDPRQRQRFQVEAQAAAHLQHPHIVPVYAVGETNGVQYYAMQFIEGWSLAAVIKDLRAWNDGPPEPSGSSSETRPASVLGPSSSPTGSNRRKGFFDALARLGSQAAVALDHAHGLGIVHRDIKPANLMIDGRGDLWVTDFGLARVPGDLDLTRSGDLLGTLRYMSPEQSQARRGVVDQRTDIYALGVTLYEALTLRPAFDGRDREELLRQIALDEPPPPRRVNPSVPRDLETIVLKAMAKDPSSRYATAREMADDLDRFRQDQPVLARRPGVVERAVKWTRRHRPVVVTAAVVGLLVSATSAGVLGMAYQRFLDRERESHAQVDHARQLSDLFSVADDLAFRAMGQLAMADTDSRGASFYPFAMERYQKIAEVCADRPEHRDVLAGAYRRIAFVQMILRYWKKLPEAHDYDASGTYQKAVDLYTALLDEGHDTEQVRDGLLGTLREQAMLFNSQGLFDQTQANGRRVVDIERKALEKDGSDENLRLALAADLASLGSALEGRGDHEEAASMLKEAAALWEGLVKSTSERPELRPRLANVGRQVVDGLKRTGPEDMSTRLSEQVQTVDPGAAANQQAWRLVRGKEATAEDAARALALIDGALAASPDRAEFLNTKGLALLRAGRHDEAAQALEASMKGKGGGNPFDWLPMAMARWHLGEKAEARHWLAKSVAAMGSSGRHAPDLLSLREEAEALVRPD